MTRSALAKAASTSPVSMVLAERQVVAELGMDARACRDRARSSCRRPPAAPAIRCATSSAASSASARVRATTMTTGSPTQQARSTAIGYCGADFMPGKQVSVPTHGAGAQLGQLRPGHDQGDARLASRPRLVSMRHDPGVGERAAHERGVQHARQGDVVGVAAAAGHRPLGAGARQGAADVAVGPGEGAGVGSCRSRAVLLRSAPAAAWPASSRRRRRWRDSRCSGSSCRTGTSRISSRLLGAACASSSAAVISMPGVQKPHCRALRATNAACRSAISPGVRQPLDGDDLGAVGLHRQHQAAAHHRAVDAHRAGAADAVLAAQMRTR